MNEANAEPAAVPAHTPIPWVIDGLHIKGPPEVSGDQPHAVESTCVAVVVSRESGSYRHYPEARAAANREFIVRAVNNHDRLLSALENALAILENFPERPAGSVSEAMVLETRMAARTAVLFATKEDAR